MHKKYKNLALITKEQSIFMYRMLQASTYASTNQYMVLCNSDPIRGYYEVAVVNEHTTASTW